jgi:hypothetical protein
LENLFLVTRDMALEVARHEVFEMSGYEEIQMTKLSVSFFTFILLTICIFCTGCGMDSTVHAQQATTPTILSGYCEASALGSVPATALMTGLGAGSDCSSLTGTTNTGLPITSAGIIQNLRVLSRFSITVTVRVNGNNTPITCNVSASGSTAAACSDTSHTAQVAAGDLISVAATSTTSSQIQGVQVSFEKQ